MGGGQGNALTGLLYVINQDPALKATEERFPGVEIKAIQDDITIIGAPDIVWGDNGALDFILKRLAERGLTPNQDKFQTLGSTHDACAGKPLWLQEPSTITGHDGVDVRARGIEMCKNPIVEEQYVKTFLVKKFKDICSAIHKISQALLPLSPHATYLAFIYSYQARFDYWLATNNLAHTDWLATDTDSFLSEILVAILGFDFNAPLDPGTLHPNFTAERVALKAKYGGLGWRPLAKRYLSLNTMCSILPQAIDRIDSEDKLI